MRGSPYGLRTGVAAALRELGEERDNFRAERDDLKAENERLRKSAMSCD